MRDDEWRLLKKRISSKNSDKWIETACEKSGGDMAVFSLPQSLTQSEQEMLDGWQEWQRNISFRVRYRSFQILSDEAAEEFLRKYNPKFCDHDAIVTIGNMDLIDIPTQILESDPFFF
eukprot:TRINITY_DN6257_c0_g2_i1.p1 TRINITY_DN6257_c0_g2~~TRINITY_DN6257_c0_g2_i1.p1  ORF type:complete len:118 (-),score=18.49 TRINITY_DN6257_c0_g2_i1:64-417(-)